MKILRSPSFWSHILIFFIAIFVLYAPTLHHGFVLDDHIGIEQNQNIRSLDTVFNTPISFFRNLLLHTSYSLGQLDPFYYRIMNIVFHFATVVGIYILIGLLVENSLVAFFSGLLFAVHPVLVEPVVWISSLTYPQYSFFVVFSLIFYILRSRSKNRIAYTLLFLLTFILSILSSEKALVFPLILLLYEWLFGSLKKNWRLLLFGFVTILIFGIVMFPFVKDRITTFAGSNVNGKVELVSPLIQIPIVIGTYVRLIFWPSRLTTYQLDELSMQQLPLVYNSIWLAVYLLSLVVSYLKSKKVFFFLSIFFIASLPALIPIHVIQLAAERYAYLGSFGLIAATVISLNEIVRKYSSKYAKYLYIFLAVCVILLAARTVVRTQDWQDEMTLRLATLRDAPYSSRAHNNVGIVLMNQGRYNDALDQYKQAIRLKPDYSHPYHNIGHMLALVKRYKEATTYYEKAQKLNPYEWKTYQDLGQVYFLLGRYAEAKPQLIKAIQLGSTDSNKLRLILKKIEETK